MKKTLSLFICFVALFSCKTTKISKEKTIAETTIEDFSAFLGLQKSDLQEKATKQFGTPTKTTKDKNDNYSFVTNYYDDANGNRIMSYTYDKKKKTVNHIRLAGSYTTNFESTKAFLKKRGIKDIKVDFLGMHRDEILKIMGTPDRVSSGNYEYKKGAVSITFICYDFRDYNCSEIYLFWNSYYTEPVEN